MDTRPHNPAVPVRLRRLNLIMLLPPVAVGGAVVVAAALLVFVRWAMNDIGRVALPCLLVTAAVWPLGVLLIDSPNASYGLAVAGSLIIPRLPRHRVAAAVALPAYIAVVGASRLLVSHDDLRGVLIHYVLVPTGVAVVVTGLMFPNKRFYDVVKDLDESREREAELAVIRERVRFASDLHDIQGHTLHVVKLKIALAQKLVRSDADRVEEELREIYDLVSDTIRQTKELAHAQRRLNLSAELENAKNLFEAAGIRVRISRTAEVDTRTSELLGQVLRETTTNILRHAQATQVRITLSESGVEIANDGVRDGPLPPLKGLLALRQRVADDGGALSVEQAEGWFVTAVTFPRTPAEKIPVPTRKGGR